MHALVAKTEPDKVVRWCTDGDFLRPVFSASCMQHISDMHSKFALRPYHVMAALSNIGGTLCSTPQSLADAHYYSAVQ